MSQVAVVYWSGTNNTKQMADEVLKGIIEAGAKGILLTPTEFDSSMMDQFDAVAFGCPSMGAEQLEESEFEPMFLMCRPKLCGKRIALFGSYGWGDGEWMRNWEESCMEDGAILACDSVICNGAPNDTASKACQELGKSLVL